MKTFLEFGEEREILAAVTRGLLASIDGRGLDRAALLAAAGLSEEAIQSPDQRVPITRHAQLGQAIRAALPDQNLGLQTGANIFGDPRGALGFVLRRSGNLAVAFQNFAFYLRVVNTAQRLSVTLGPGGAEGSLVMVPELAAVAHPAEALFSAWVAIGRHLTGVPWNPVRVSFVHDPVGDTSEHQAFFRCTVAFRCEPSVLTLSFDDGTLPIPLTPHELAPRLDQALIQAARRLAEKQHPNDGLERLRAAFASGRICMENIYKICPEPERLELARVLLEEPGTTRFEAAFLAGFDDLRAFEQRLNLGPG